MQDANKKGFPIIRIIVILCLIIAGLVYFILLGYMRHVKEAAYQQGLTEAGIIPQTIKINDEIIVDVATLKKVVAPASKLISYEYHYTDVGVYEKSSTLFGKIDIPFTTDKTLYTYSGKVSAGIDLDAIDFDVDQNKKLITVIYPEIKVLAHEMNQGFNFYDLKKAKFNSSDFNDFEAFRSGLKREEESKIMRDSDFLDSAKMNTENIIESLISAEGMLDEYTIIHKWK